jgi:hypothetical protein
VAHQTQRREPLITAVTLGAALLGGVLAAAPWAAPWWQRAAVVLLGAVIGTALAVPTRSPERSADQRTEEPVLPPSDSAERLAGLIEQPPLVEQPPVIAQCPWCGEFRLHVVPDAAGYRLHCLAPGCAHTWRWAPGTPWPPVVVRRDLAGPGTRPGAHPPGSGDPTSADWGRT